MNVYGKVKVQLHNFLPRRYMEVSGQLHSSAALFSGKGPLVPIG
jgi:hypothetical protein